MALAYAAFLLSLVVAGVKAINEGRELSRMILREFVEGLKRNL